MLKWREGQRRKSPRVSALGMCNSRGANRTDDSVCISPQNDITEKINDYQDQEEGPASRTRARNKRKLPIPHDDDTAVSPLTSYFVKNNQPYVRCACLCVDSLFSVIRKKFMFHYVSMKHVFWAMENFRSSCSQDDYTLFPMKASEYFSSGVLSCWTPKGPISYWVF